MNNLKRKTLSLIWDTPEDMGGYTKLLRYEILHAADGAIHSNQVKCYMCCLVLKGYSIIAFLILFS